jgi:hypothetical protein
MVEMLGEDPIKVEGSEGKFITLADLAEAIAEKTGVEPERQKLFFAGKPLKDFAATLKELGLQKGGMIELFPIPPVEVCL